MTRASFRWRRPILVLGLDCANPDALLTQLREWRKAFTEADAILAAPHFLRILEQDAELAPRLDLLSFPVAQTAAKLAANAAAGCRSLVLAHGDPLFFGIGASLLHYLDPELMEFIPAISCLQAACARLGLPWHELTALSLHGRSDFATLLAAIRMRRSICLLLGNGPGPDAVARLLQDRGITEYRIHVLSSMGHDEIKGAYSLAECAAMLFPPCSTMILLPLPVAARKLELAGKYHTSDAAAAMILKALMVETGDTAWDVGSGSGSVALEISRIASAGVTYAIERQSVRIYDMQLNRKTAGAANLELAYGEAPQILEKLPDPQKIFIGGGLSDEKGWELLEYCAKRLTAGGRLAVSCILLESLNLCRKFMAKMKWPAKIWQLQASEVEILGNGERFKACNPVFVLALEKPLINMK